MYFIYFILGYVVGPLIIGWAVGMGKHESVNAISVSLFIYVVVIIFIAIGMFIKYKWG